MCQFDIPQNYRKIDYREVARKFLMVHLLQEPGGFQVRNKWRRSPFSREEWGMDRGWICIFYRNINVVLEGLISLQKSQFGEGRRHHLRNLSNTLGSRNSKSSWYPSNFKKLKMHMGRTPLRDVPSALW